MVMVGTACGCFSASWKLLRNNPELAKVMLAAALQAASGAVADTFILSVLRGQVWGDRMAEYGSAFGIAFNVWAATTGGPFGRFTDSVDRRWACIAAGVLSFIPVWVLVFFRTAPSTGLMASSVARVLCAVGFTSNTVFALAVDVTPFEDRDVASGVYFAVSNISVIILNGLPSLLILWLKVWRIDHWLMLYCSMALSAAYFLCIAWVRLRHGVRGPEEEEQPSPTRKFADVKGGRLAAIREPLQLIFRHRRLRRLFLTLFFIGIGDTFMLAIGGQFFNQCMGLIPYGSESQFAMVNAVSSLTGTILAVPGLLLAGLLAKQGGALRLSRQLIPLSAAFMSVGAFLAVVRQIWFVGVVVTLLSYSGLPRVPLSRIVAGVAPPGRMGEALSAMGVVAQAAGLLANCIVVLLNRSLIASPLANPLWVYYPAGGILTLLAVLPLLGAPKGGWGAAAGLLKDVLFSVVWARVADARWKRFVQRRRKTRELADAAAAAVAAATGQDVDLEDQEVGEGHGHGPMGTNVKTVLYSLGTGLDFPDHVVPTGPETSPSQGMDIDPAGANAARVRVAPPPVLLGRVGVGAGVGLRLPAGEDGGEGEVAATQGLKEKSEPEAGQRPEMRS